MILTKIYNAKCMLLPRRRISFTRWITHPGSVHHYMMHKLSNKDTYWQTQTNNINKTVRIPFSNILIWSSNFQSLSRFSLLNAQLPSPEVAVCKDRKLSTSNIPPFYITTSWATVLTHGSRQVGPDQRNVTMEDENIIPCEIVMWDSH